MALKAGLPTWASLLYLPADTAQVSAAPLGCRPDAVILDLEDFVPWSAKAAARARIGELAEGFCAHGIDVVVRINRPLELAVADLDSAVIPHVRALMLTKVAGAEHVRLLDETVGVLEVRRGLPEGGIQLVGMVETAAALPHMGAIATAVPRMAAITLGGEDLAQECRMRPGEATLLLSKQQLVHAAAAAGVLPWGYLASVADATDDAAFRAMVARSRDFGFRTASCLRASQVQAVNDIYAATLAEHDAARRVLHAVAHGGVLPGGRPVDADALALARWTLARGPRAPLMEAAT